MTLIKPNFPELPNLPEFLASYGFSSAELKQICVEKVEVTGISSLELDTVKVTYLGSSFTDIPVWIHTDEGCYKNRYNDTVQTDPQEYYKGAARLFICGEGTKPLAWNDALNVWDDCNLVGAEFSNPSAYALVNTVTGIPIAIVDVESSHNDTEDLRTYRLLIGVKNRSENAAGVIDTSIHLIDAQTGDYADIPDAAFVNIVEATYGTSWADYAHIFEEDITGNYPGCIRLVVADILSSGNNCGNISALNITETVFYDSIHSLRANNFSSDTDCQPLLDPSDSWIGPYTNFYTYDKTTSCATGSYEFAEKVGTDYTGSAEVFHTDYGPNAGFKGTTEDLIFYFGHKIHSFELATRTVIFETDISFTWAQNGTAPSEGQSTTTVMTVNNIDHTVADATYNYAKGFASPASPYGFISAPNFIAEFSFFTLCLATYESPGGSSRFTSFLPTWEFEFADTPLAIVQQQQIQNILLESAQKFFNDGAQFYIGGFSQELALIAVPFDFRVLDI